MKKKFRLFVLFICLTSMLSMTVIAYADQESSAAANTETAAQQQTQQTQQQTQPTEAASGQTAETSAASSDEQGTVPSNGDAVTGDGQQETAEGPVEGESVQESVESFLADGTTEETPANTDAILYSVGKELLIKNFDSEVNVKPVGLKEAEITINGQVRIGLVPGSYQNGSALDYVVLFGEYTDGQGLGFYRYDLADQTLQKYYASEAEVPEPAEGEEVQTYYVTIEQAAPVVNEDNAASDGQEVTEAAEEEIGEQDARVSYGPQSVELGNESMGKDKKVAEIYLERDDDGNWKITEQKYHTSSFMRILPYIIIGVLEAVVIMVVALLLGGSKR